jgi:MSHA biogenesis protein MshK
VSRTFTKGVVAVAVMLVVIVNAAAETREDPLRPPTYRDTAAGPVSQPGAPVWRVDEILISDSRRVAIVNGNSVKQGEYVNGARVVAIEPGYVTLKYNNKLITAPITLAPVKRRVAVRAEKQDG